MPGSKRPAWPGGCGNGKPCQERVPLTRIRPWRDVQACLALRRGGHSAPRDRAPLDLDRLRTRAMRRRNTALFTPRCSSAPPVGKPRPHGSGCYSSFQPATCTNTSVHSAVHRRGRKPTKISRTGGCSPREPLRLLPDHCHPFLAWQPRFMNDARSDARGRMRASSKESKEGTLRKGVGYVEASSGMPSSINMTGIDSRMG